MTKSMLTGRESLKRLIGKRGRFLHNRHSILSSTLPQRSLSLCKKQGNDSIGTSSDSAGLSNCNGGPEWVTCPICGAKVRGHDEVINSHLDVCLARGTKRKLSQRTLFQLNFCSRSKVRVRSIDLDHTETIEVFNSNIGDNNLCKTLRELKDSDAFEECSSIQRKSSDSEAFEECRSIQCKFSSDSIALKSNRFAVSVENVVSGNKMQNGVDSPSLPCGDKISEDYVEAPLDDDDLSVMSLQTFIVGRRFAEETELNPRTKIFLLRDPENPKDQNAIKVLSADSGYGKMLGFLPRELAQHVSPLIDKFDLCFEGHVTSVPKHPWAVVPIEIMCQNKLLHGEKFYDNLEVLKSLWGHALCAVETAKTTSPGIAKYQNNLVVLIQEVLRSSSHLFTDFEKTFLETLISLSDDSQRLFARLYTRKGPWFRMSNISYPEIFDHEGAIKQLSAAGYICSLEAMDEIHDDDFKEILNVLNIYELQEMARTVNNKGMHAFPDGCWFYLVQSLNSLIFSPLVCSTRMQNFCWQIGKKLKKVPHGMKKQDLIGLLLSSYKGGKCLNLPSLLLLKTAACIRITETAESLIWLAERLFFLNGEQDLSAFLLVDIGIVKYPTYNCIIPEQIFQTRSDLTFYEEAIGVAQIMDESLDDNNFELVIRCIEVSDYRISNSFKAVQSLPSRSTTTYLSCFSASWVYSKVLLLGVSFLEHKKSYTDAINLLKRLLINFTSDGRRGYWTLRLSVDLEHVGRIDESLQVAEHGLQDPWVRAGSRVALQRRVLRLGKPPRRWTTPSFSQSVKRDIREVHVEGRPLNSKIGIKSIFYNEDGEQCGVEQLALRYYSGEGGGWQGVHTESGIWLTLFGLLMWDIIFADVPGAFCTKFQTAPLDLETDCFYVARRSLIEELLKKIEGGMAEEILIASWQLHVGTVCRGVNWERHSLSELRAAATCIGGPCLSSICRQLAQDYQNWSSGMPDLLLWRFYDDYMGEAKLVEVKGPGDRLSEQQRAWLLFLMDFGFSVEVCKVSPPVSKVKY